MLYYATTNGSNHGGICGGTMTSLYKRNGGIGQLCSSSQQDI